MNAPHPRRFDVLLAELSFPEAPRWRDGKLWFSDFYTQRVQAVDLDGRVETIVVVPNRPSGLGFAPDGGLLVVSMLDRSLLRVEGQALRVVAELGAFATGPCNDMVVDASGTAYVGNFGYDKNNGEALRPACLMKVDPEGSVTIAATDLVFPNGTVIAPDRKTLIISETFASRLTAFTIDDDGNLQDRRVFAHLDNAGPDGICLDAEGAVWVADASGNRVLRVKEGGQIVESLSMGDRGAYACMLGGVDRKTLFVVTNSGSGHQMAHRRDGRIETTRVEVPGVGLP